MNKYPNIEEATTHPSMVETNGDFHSGLLKFIEKGRNVSDKKQMGTTGSKLKYCAETSDMKVFFFHGVGQYDGRSKPLPEYHAKITGFDERVRFCFLFIYLLSLKSMWAVYASVNLCPAGKGDVLHPSPQTADHSRG